MMESEAQPQDVNVYITVDPASVENYRNSKSNLEQKQPEWSLLMEELGREPAASSDWSLLMEELCRELCASKFMEGLYTHLGFLMLWEIVLSLTLLLFAAIADGYVLGYEARAYGIAANSITLLVLVLLFVLSSGFLADIWQPRVAFLLALKIATRVILLILQFVAFILMIAEHRGWPHQTAFIIITILFCCVLIVTIFLHKVEFSVHMKTRPSPVTKRRKLKRGKPKGYKRLGRSSRL